MINKELIEKLKQLPLDVEVFTWNDHTGLLEEVTLPQIAREWQGLVVPGENCLEEIRRIVIDERLGYTADEENITDEEFNITDEEFKEIILL